MLFPHVLTVMYVLNWVQKIESPCRMRQWEPLQQSTDPSISLQTLNIDDPTDGWVVALQIMINNRKVDGWALSQAASGFSSRPCWFCGEADGYYFGLVTRTCYGRSDDGTPLFRIRQLTRTRPQKRILKKKEAGSERPSELRVRQCLNVNEGTQNESLRSVDCKSIELNRIESRWLLALYLTLTNQHQTRDEIDQLQLESDWSVSIRDTCFLLIVTSVILILVRTNQLSLTRRVRHRCGVCSHSPQLFHSTCSWCCTGIKQPDAQLAWLVAASRRMRFRGLIGDNLQQQQLMSSLSIKH